MKVVLFFSLLFTLLLLSCTNKKSTGIVTFQISKSDYIETLYVPGTIQAVVNFPVMPPMSMFGQMTVVRLAADGANVNKGDTLCILTLQELESMYYEMINTNEKLAAELKKTEADNAFTISLLEAQLALSEVQLKISSLDSLQMTYATEVQQRLLALEMKRAMIQKQKIEKKLVASKIIGQTGIKQMNSRIIQQKAKTQQFEDQLKSMTIIAQRDGIVMRTESPRMMIMGSGGSGSFGGPIQEGSVLSPFGSFPVLQFPDLSKMQVSSEVAEADFKKIEKGQKVFITVDAAKKLTTTGTVSRKSLMGKTAQRWSDSKVKFYEVIINIDSCHLKMKPGLSAECKITLKEALDTVFIPTLAIFERDSSKVVYVNKLDKFIPVKVETGLTGGSFTIITRGLIGDEIIALSEPPGSLIRIETKKSEIRDTVKNHTSN
jgi:multidrug efflux pump subunit AcrA (membrane-fusion protein)